MRYALGIDLGTTFSAAAIAEGDRVEIFTLGSVAPAIPSVVLLRDDGEVVDAVSERQGAAPDRISITHPANYGPYKKDLLSEMVRLADIGQVDFLSEPEAAAINYAQQDRLEPGEVVAVYDFGGGTFDAALLRKGVDGFELLGRPEGMERLGGIDFDQAIFIHVDDAVGGMIGELDSGDPQARAAIARLRADVRAAKEALSTDTDVTIPVMLPGLQTDVRLTRAEFEGMVRPRLTETIEALQRAVRSTGLTIEEISRILLVGGSSRIPLVAEMVRSATGRPVAVDAHPTAAGSGMGFPSSSTCVLAYPGLRPKTASCSFVRPSSSRSSQVHSGEFGMVGLLPRRNSAPSDTPSSSVSASNGSVT